MKKHKKKNDIVSILFVRGANDSNVSFKLHFNMLRTIVLLFICFAVAVILFLVFYSRITTQLFFVNSIVKENRELKEREKKYLVIYSEIDQIREYEKKIKIITQPFIPKIKAAVISDSLKISIKDSILQKPETAKIKLKETVEIRTEDIDKNIDIFIQNFRLHRNMNFLSITDEFLRQKKVFESGPNILPVDGWISRGFNTLSDVSNAKKHLGTDIAAAINSPIHASGPGIVIFAGWKNDFGFMIEIDHGYGFVSRYGHCSQLLVKRGDLVERSQTIALVGSSGRSSAPHLHFEILKDGKRLDPLTMLILK